MVRLQSILLPDESICQVEELYFHRSIDNRKENRIDFDGYFNLFYIEKRKKYTRIEDLKLELTLYGYKSLILVHDGKDIKTVALEANERKTYTIELPYGDVGSGIFWFALIREKSVENFFVSGAYTSDRAFNQAYIGIDICTYKREAYVERNLTLLKNKILDNDKLEVSKHIEIYVIDNGRTLNNNEKIQQIKNGACEKIQQIKNGACEKIHILDNKNSGGAGGFTRGMIELLSERDKKEKAFTHVLLMDDDATIEPDAIVRIYGFLATAREEYKDITLGGTMLREDFPYMLFCSGEWWNGETIERKIRNLDIRKRKAAAGKYLTKACNERGLYSGWWCCCYSLGTVRSDNLPIPLFIHYDDIEFGIRNKNNGCVFLNGVAVWHKGFELNFSGVNRYYDARNGIIQISLHTENKKKKTALKYYFKMLTVALIRMRYKDARLIYYGLKDFLRGPEWLYKQDPEKLNNKMQELTYKTKSLRELDGELTTLEMLNVQKQIGTRKRQLSLEKIIKDRKLRDKASLLRYITLNGWLLPSKKDVAVTLSTDSPFYIFRRKKVVCYEVSSGKAFITEKSYREFLKLIVIYIKSLWLILIKLDSAIRDYDKNISKITNQKSWERYLNISQE